MTVADRGSSAMMSPREWRFVRVGTLVSAVALVTVFGVLPFVRHWREREAQLGAERERFARLQSLVAHRASIDSTVLAREAQLASMPRRVFRARSRALASSSLQSLLQDLAEQSNVTVSRLDVAGGGSGGGSMQQGTSPGDSSAAQNGSEQLPVSMSAIGDVYGLTAFLRQLRDGPRVVNIDRVSVQVNSALRGAPDVLQITISMHAPAIIE